mmetsp:Transcript_30936/g.72147  ORF Transcript_30936/g.72147 Transcript_30936/m.72147 type:complete len:237 (-) Transcript_30936:8-718(-)
MSGNHDVVDAVAFWRSASQSNFNPAASEICSLNIDNDGLRRAVLRQIRLCTDAAVIAAAKEKASSSAAGVAPPVPLEFCYDIVVTAANVGPQLARTNFESAQEELKSKLDQWWVQARKATFQQRLAAHQDAVKRLKADGRETSAAALDAEEKAWRTYLHAPAPELTLSIHAVGPMLPAEERRSNSDDESDHISFQLSVSHEAAVVLGKLAYPELFRSSRASGGEDLDNHWLWLWIF